MVRKLAKLAAVLLAIALAIPATVFWFRNTDAGYHWLERQIEINSHKMLMRSSADAVPIPFVTDGCSGGVSLLWHDLVKQFPVLSKDIGQSLPWESCCAKHDRTYHNAAATDTASDSFEARIIADQALRICIAEFGENQPEMTTEYTLLANALYTAVRLGGAPCTGLSWRWGFGFPPCHIGRQIFGN